MREIFQVPGQRGRGAPGVPVRKCRSVSPGCSMSESQTTVFDAPLGDLAQTPLYALHRALGARMIGFAGYALPVHYPAGIINEHLHTREKATLFDVSHMGQAVLAGREAARQLESLVPGDITTLSPGKMRYTQLLDDEGHILDDLMVTRLDDSGGRERLGLVLNAAAKREDFNHIAAALPDCALTVLDRALLAVQGPEASKVLGRLLSPDASACIMGMPFLSAASVDWQGVDLAISRSGYTGEDGFELSLAPEAAEGFAKALLADTQLQPAGLGARDSLRLEAGLCLYGHDIDHSTDPVEAGLLWSISKRRRAEGGFAGYEQVKEAIDRGPARLRVGLLLDGKALAREGAEIIARDGQAIGRVTSGGYAPSLGQPVAMGYVTAASSVPGTIVFLMVRGKPLAARIVPMPFVPHRYFRGA